MKYFCHSCPAGTKSSQRGFTLIEIMIAMLLGVFLIGGIQQIFIGSRQTYKMQENLSRLLENGRFAMYFLEKDIRMTSYWACLKRASGDIAGGNDTITLKAAFVTTPTGSCGETVDKTASYYTDASSTIIYSINNTVLQKNNIDLIEDIENMQILYGEDTDATPDGTANYYVPAKNIVDMEKVVSIHVSLLVRSMDDNLAAQPLAYTYNGATVTPTDRRIRRVFTSTIALRNRLP